jgi:hypothetical protein
MNKPKKDITLIVLATALVILSLLDFPELYSKTINGEAVMMDFVIKGFMFLCACFLLYRGFFPVNKS